MGPCVSSNFERQRRVAAVLELLLLPCALCVGVVRPQTEVRQGGEGAQELRRRGGQGLLLLLMWRRLHVVWQRREAHVVARQRRWRHAGHVGWLPRVPGACCRGCAEDPSTPTEAAAMASPSHQSIGLGLLSVSVLRRHRPQTHSRSCLDRPTDATAAAAAAAAGGGPRALIERRRKSQAPPARS